MDGSGHAAVGRSVGRSAASSETPAATIRSPVVAGCPPACSASRSVFHLKLLPAPRPPLLLLPIIPPARTRAAPPVPTPLLNCSFFPPPLPSGSDFGPLARPMLQGGDRFSVCPRCCWPISELCGLEESLRQICVAELSLIKHLYLTFFLMYWCSRHRLLVASPSSSYVSHDARGKGLFVGSVCMARLIAV